VAGGSAGAAVQGEGRGGRLSGFAGGSVRVGQIAGAEAVCVRVWELSDLRLFDCVMRSLGFRVWPWRTCRTCRF
jgi:hypothetical protein